MWQGMVLPKPVGPISVVAVDLTGDRSKTCAGAILSFDRRWRLSAPAVPLDSDESIIALRPQHALIALDGPRRPPSGFSRFMRRGETPPPEVARSRLCEREHTRRVCPIFYSSPVATQGVQHWMVRSWALFAALEQEPIEIYPMGAFVAALNGVERRRPHGLSSKTSVAGREQRLALLAKLGVEARDFVATAQGSEKPHDRVDAAMGALVAACHVLGRSVELGCPDEGTVVLPGLRTRALG